MDKILILDFGSQVTQLIARRVREAHVYCELHPFDMPIDEIRAFAPKAIILSGGPNSVYESDYQADPAVFELGVPVLGICYGMQFMAQTLGGKVEAGDKREFGYAQIQARHHSKLLEGLQDHVDDAGNGFLDVWMSHGDKVTALPAGFNVIAETPSCPIAAMADEARGFYAVQFHPEVTHTKRGTEMLHRFVLHVANAKPSWTMPNYIEEAVQKIRDQVGDEEVILGLSGGVDSSVAARPDPPRHWRPAHLRFCRPRPAAPERRQDGDGNVRAEPGRESDPRRRHRTVHEQAGRRSRPGEKAQKSSVVNSSRYSSANPASSPTPNGWHKAPSTRT